MKISAKQKLFCEEYLIDLNAAQAAIRAGYSPNGVAQTAHNVLAKPHVQAYLQKKADARSKRTEITADRVLKEIAKLGFSDIRKLFTESGSILHMHDVDDVTAAAIQSVEVITRPSGEVDDDGSPIVERVHKFRLADKGQNLERLGRHLKLFTDRIEHTGQVVVKNMKGVDRG